MPYDSPSYISITSTQTTRLASFLSRGDGFYHIKASELPDCIPEPLRRQWDSAAVVISGSTGSDGALMVVGHRIDAKAGKMDQDPFAVAVSASVPAGSGVLLHHPSFDSRSLTLPSAFTSALSSGLSNYYHSNPPFGVSSGSTGQLPPPLVQALEIVKGLLPRSSNSAV